MGKYILLAFCFAIASCKSSTESNNPQSQDVIMPLAVGNMWAYHDQTFHKGISGSYDDTLKIVFTIFFGKDSAYKNKYDTYYQNKGDGLWIMPFGSSDFILSAKYPGNAGDVFGHDVTIITNESSPDPIDSAGADIRIDSVNATVTVPAGTYQCYKYNADYYDSKHQLLIKENNYYSVNTGLIKRERFELDSASQLLKLNETYQLTKVVLK
jgi:hypothetical protein